MGAWDTVGAGGLGVPDPPAALAARIERHDEHHWGTRATLLSFRDLGSFEREFLAGEAPGDYVLAAREDAATNTGAVQYILVAGRLGLFVNVGIDETGRRALRIAAELQDRALLALDDGPLHGDGKLAVLHHQLSTRRWSWTGPDPDGGIDGLDGALAWLGARVRHAG